MTIITRHKCPGEIPHARGYINRRVVMGESTQHTWPHTRVSRAITL